MAKGDFRSHFPWYTVMIGERWRTIVTSYDEVAELTVGRERSRFHGYHTQEEATHAWCDESHHRWRQLNHVPELFSPDEPPPRIRQLRQLSPDTSYPANWESSTPSAQASTSTSSPQASRSTSSARAPLHPFWTQASRSASLTEASRSSTEAPASASSDNSSVQTDDQPRPAKRARNDSVSGEASEDDGQIFTNAQDAMNVVFSLIDKFGKIKITPLP
ncbi:hypothetical protein NXS19_011040 [Fusarium pseudograminearum]|nr:hypothetical protein NXS19_011040 [Fusarium pseudograminearum]